MNRPAVGGLLRGGLFPGVFRGLVNAASRFLGNARLLGRALRAYALKPLLLAAGDFNYGGCLDGEKLAKQLGKQAVYAARTHVGHALFAGGAHGEHAVFEGEIGIAVEQEWRGTRAFMPHKLDQQRRDARDVCKRALFKRRVGDLEPHAHRGESVGKRAAHALVFLARAQPVGAQPHAHFARLFRD